MSETVNKPTKKKDLNSAKRAGQRPIEEDISGAPKPKEEPIRLTEIKLGADLFRIVDQTSAALCKDPDLYQREGSLVMLVDKGTGPTISALSRASLKERLSRVADFLAMREKEWVSVKPPQDVVDALFDRKSWPGVRHLIGVREAPFLRPDGSVCQQPGYDEQTRFILATKVAFPKVPEQPTRDQAVIALSQLLELVTDFPFASEEHRAAWVALVLTLFGRSAIEGPCPLFAIDANTRGSGKSRLADVAALLLSGSEAPRTIQTDNEEEMRKRVLANCIDGKPFTLMDNVRGTLGGATLEATITGTSFTDRALGKNENVTAAALVVWACTGNNLNFTDDMARRTLPIRLESPLENPESRSDFKIPNLIAHVRIHRPQLVVSALTVWRAWFVAGCPTDSALLLWGSFEAWTSRVVPVLCWLGLPSPMAAHEALTQNDNNKGAIYAFLSELRALLDRKGIKDISSREMLEEAYPTRTLSAGGYALAQAFRSVMEDLLGVPSSKQPSSKQLGYVLRLYKGRRIHDLRLINTPEKDGVRWSVAAFS